MNLLLFSGGSLHFLLCRCLDKGLSVREGTHGSTCKSIHCSTRTIDTLFYTYDRYTVLHVQ